VSKQTVYRMVPSGAHMVLYKFNGQGARFISLDRSNAEEYAAKHHGVVFPLFMENFKYLLIF